MRALLVPVTAAAILVSSFAAFAADTTTSGMVKSFDLKANTLTLDNGTVYTLPTGFKDPGLKVGEKVSVAWNLMNSKHVADKVTITK